jgi:hypothetical protein
MSRRSSSDEAAWDVYTGLSVVSLTAILIAVILLFFELQSYSNVTG